MNEEIPEKLDELTQRYSQLLEQRRAITARLETGALAPGEILDVQNELGELENEIATLSRGLY